MANYSRKQGYDRQDIFGDVHHYDAKGRETGVSRKDFFGDYVNFDAKGRKTGTSVKDPLTGSFTHYDEKGNKIGRTSPGFLSGFNHYDAKGNKTGTSSGIPGFDNYRHDTTGRGYMNIGYREPVWRDIPRSPLSQSPMEITERKAFDEYRDKMRSGDESAPSSENVPLSTPEKKTSNTGAGIIIFVIVIFILYLIGAHDLGQW